jgi:hypothetical protein
MSDLNIGLALLTVVAATFWTIGLTKRQNAHAELLRASALRQFRSVVVEAEDATMQFYGETAVIVREEEIGGARGLLSKEAQYTLTLYAVNKHGEYFMFKSSPNAPYVKHVSRRMAQHVLKNLSIPEQ